jgi:two-component system, OmpR family, sensor histidine kinase KdpD
MWLQREALDKAHVALVYLLVVLGASAHAGRRYGLTTSFLAFLLLNFLFVPPYHTFAVAQRADWLVLAVFLITSATAAHLLSRAQDQTREASDRAAEIDRLSALGAETLNLARPEDALSAIAEVIRSTLGMQGVEVFTCYGTEVARSATAGLVGPVGGTEYVTGEQVVEWAARSGQTIVERVDAAARMLPERDTQEAGPNIDVRDARGLMLPLKVQGRTVGVLRLTSGRPMDLSPSQRRFLKALAYYAALGVDRVRLVGDAKEAQALREADRMKDALLASVSHDLRTPLTTIKAIARDLRMEGEDRAMIIEEEADRLNRFVADLLDLSQIAAGAMTVRAEIHPIDDLIGAALQRVEGRAKGHEITARLAPDDPLLVGRFDFSHSLRALVNLLENALKHSPAGQSVDLVVRRSSAGIAIAVEDRGPGIPPADMSRVFRPFSRVEDKRDGGAGLGLSIARGLALAQGGDIDYSRREGGGSVFTFWLPAADLDAALASDLMKS